VGFVSVFWWVLMWGLVGGFGLGIWVGFDLWVSGYCVAEDRFTAEHEGEWWVLRWVLFVWGYWKG
jgi:hypothetical protein